MSKDMRIITKESFETLVGSTISDSDFSKIKKCFELLTIHWKDENALAWSFRTFGMEHFDHIFSECVRIEKKLIESGEISAKYASFSGEKVCLEHDGNCNDEPDGEINEDKSGTDQAVDMAALKEHFESITNCTVTDNEYYRIEKCINAFSDLLASDNDIVLFYHTFGINGIDHLLCDFAGFKAVEDHLREKADKEHRKYFNLRYKYNRLNSHIVSFVQALSKFFKEILDDPVFNSDFTSYKLAIGSLVDYFDNEVLRHEGFESEVK